MKISILGGGGFLGRKVAARLARDGTPRRPSRHRPDAVRSRRTRRSRQPRFPVDGDRRRPGGPAAGAPIPPGTDVVFHLAAVVSAQAEADYDLGRRVNLRGTDAVIDACRRLVAAGRQAAARGVHLLGRELLRRPGRVLDGRCAAGAGEQLWRAEGGGRTDPGGCLAPRLPRCGVDPTADGDRPSRPAQPRRQLVPLGHRSRAAAGAAGGTAGAGRLRRLGVQPAPRGGLAAARRRDGHRSDGPRPERQSARHQHHDRPPAAGARCGEARRVEPRAARRGQGDRCHRRPVAAGVRGDAGPDAGFRHARAVGGRGAGVRRGRPGGHTAERGSRGFRP